jgi:hypothetical protein
MTGGGAVGPTGTGGGPNTGGRIETGPDGFSAAKLLTDVTRKVTKAKPVMHRMCRCPVLIVTPCYCEMPHLQ